MKNCLGRGSADLWDALHTNIFPRTFSAGLPYVVVTSMSGGVPPMDSTVLSVLPRGMSILVLAAGMIAQAPNGRANTVAQIAPDVRQALAPGGKLRVGVYPGSPTSMIRDSASGETKGLAYELGQELARRLNVPFEPVEFTQIADVLDALKGGAVDFTVTNASPARAKDVDFTAPILGVELGYLVSPRSSIATLADDRPGVRVGVTAGGSSHTTLQREFKHATVVPSASVTAAVEMLADGKVDAYATNKAILFEMSDQSPGSRVLDGRWGSRCSRWASRRAGRLPCQRSEDLQTKRDPKGSSGGRRTRRASRNRQRRIDQTGLHTIQSLDVLASRGSVHRLGRAPAPGAPARADRGSVSASTGQSSRCRMRDGRYVDLSHSAGLGPTASTS